MSEVTDLVDAIKKKASKQGLYLHRYQTNGGNHSVTVTYCLHSEKGKPHRSTACDGPCVVMRQLEGTTKRCEAYKKLLNLYNKI